MVLKNICCQSVINGWQSAFIFSDIRFGPVSKKVQDLWDWQSKNLYQDSGETTS